MSWYWWLAIALFALATWQGVQANRDRATLRALLASGFEGYGLDFVREAKARGLSLSRGGVYVALHELQEAGTVESELEPMSAMTPPRKHRRRWYRPKSEVD